jgi:hypothetical protein
VGGYKIPKNPLGVIIPGLGSPMLPKGLLEGLQGRKAPARLLVQQPGGLVACASGPCGGLGGRHRLLDFSSGAWMDRWCYRQLASTIEGGAAMVAPRSTPMSASVAGTGSCRRGVSTASTTIPNGLRRVGRARKPSKKYDGRKWV